MTGYRTRSWARRRRGYLLVVTVFVIAMVAIMTVGFARLSMNQAVSTLDAERDLQAKWGVASCERFAFKNHALLLSKQEWSDVENRIVSKPVPRSTCTFQLGEQEFDIRLDDESAKLNVNFVMKESNLSNLKTVTRKVASVDAASIRPLPIRLNRLEPNEQPFEALGQLYGEEGKSGQSPDELRRLSETVTCWGNTVNYQTASEDILYETAKVTVGATNASKIQRARSRSQIPEIIGGLALDSTRMDEISRRFQPRSTAQSIWIINSSPTFVRHTFSVREQRTRTMVRVSSFSW